jgi:hypothetical protein
MNSIVRISLISLGGILATLGWFLALGGIASFQNTGEISASDVGFAWWTIWFHFFVYIGLLGTIFYSYKNNCIFYMTSRMFVFLITILAVLCMYVTNSIVYGFMLVHQQHNSNCVGALRAATGGFVLLSIQNLIVGSGLTFLEQPKQELLLPTSTSSSGGSDDKI